LRPAKFHVPAFVAPLEFDDDEIRSPMQAQKVDAALGVLPLSKFLCDHQDIGRDHADVGPK
jgi:hypothetical protein